MFLNEVHDQLCSSEFQLSAIAKNGAIATDKLGLVNTIIQAGITDLNKLFTIKEGELLLRTKTGKQTYELIPANAISNNPFGFIIDSVDEPFLGDIMQILRVTNSSGESLWLNTDVPQRAEVNNIFGIRPDLFTHTGINMPTYNSLKFHKDHDGDDYLVHYKAKLKPLDKVSSPETVDVGLPDHFMNALVLYVASRFFNPKGAETIGRGMFHEGNNYWTKYQEETQSLKSSLGSIASTGETTIFQRGGWV